MASIRGIYKQTKELDGFPYNSVGEQWNVSNINGKYTILKNNGIGLGVTEQELEEHFELVSYQDNLDSDSYDDEYEEYDYDDEDEYDNDEVIDEEYYQEDESKNKQVSKFKSFLQKIGLTK